MISPCGTLRSSNNAQACSSSPRSPTLKTSVVDPEGLRVKSYQVEVQLQAEVYPVQVDDQLLVLIMA